MKKTLQQLFSEFILECEFIKKLRPETVRGYCEIFSTFSKLLPGSTVETINSHLLVNFFKLLETRHRTVGKGTIKKGVTKATIATYRSKLNCFFEWLFKNNLILTNPFKVIPFPSVEHSERKFLEKEDVEKIFTAIFTHHNQNLLLLKRNTLIFHFLLFCGLRRNELMFLQIRDLDLERKIVTIRAESSKSKRDRRLPLHPEIIFRLKDYFIERKKYTTQYLFVSSTHDRELSHDGMKHLVHKLNVASGVKFHLHQFRHTFAINYLKQSSNIFKLKELLGHKDIKQTALYLRQLPIEELRPELETMTIDNLI